MTRPSMTLAQWDIAFNNVDMCPWPGPKPMVEGAEGLLVGRDKDIRNFVSDVVQHQIVVLHGASGVGKSSMLNVGIVAGLKAHGLEPIVCSDWARTATSEEDPDAFVASKIRHPEDIAARIDLSRIGDLGLVAQLDKAFGDNAVLVLDQFEELIRYQPAHFRRTIEWVQGINRDHRVRVVLSLRSEYLHQLRALDRVVRPFSMARYELEPLRDPEVILKIVNSANSADSRAITAEAATLLTKAWAGSRGDLEASETSGLLQLQATLYALHAKAAGSSVNDEHVAEMIASSSDNIFTLGLTEAVALKLKRCADACSSSQDGSVLDPVLVDGTRVLVERAVGHLSSGGYKLVREEWDLAEKTLERELDILNVDRGDAERLFRVLSRMTGTDTSPDFLSAPRPAIIQSALGAVPADPAGTVGLEHLGVNPAPWFTDQSDVSSGPMQGMQPLAILVEELRRFAFAMQWLSTASLVRPSSPTADQTMLSLIHDGFSRALDLWVRKADNDPAEALSLLTAARGEYYDWKRSEVDLHWPVFDGTLIHPRAGSDSDDSDSDIAYRTVINVRWSNCKVSARFRQVAFVNCDFRGTRFAECEFRGVVFINCLLDSASFENCTIRGKLDSYVKIPEELKDALEKRKELPSFQVQVDKVDVETLNYYRGTMIDGVAQPNGDRHYELYSITSGVPVVPWDGRVTNVLKWQPQSGGLVMFGGRLSSLMIRDCVFEEGGAIAFRHTAGSALDIVEQSVGRIEVFSSVIRGLTVTRKVGDPESENAVGGFELQVRDSVLANTWFGGRLVGRADFENSVLWQLVNVSDRSLFKVHVDNCTRFGLVNLSGYPNSPTQEGFGIDGVFGQAWTDLNTNSGLMDYRSRPAQLELEHRRVVGEA